MMVLDSANPGSCQRSPTYTYDVPLEPVTVRTEAAWVSYAIELPIFAREDHPEVSDLE